MIALMTISGSGGIQARGTSHRTGRAVVGNSPHGPGSSSALLREGRKPWPRVDEKSGEIREYEPVDGIIPFELLIDGESVWFGMGDDRAEGLLQAIMTAVGEEPEVPNN